MLSLILLSFITSSIASKLCDDAYQCQGETIWHNQADCNGYYSCKQATIQTADHEVNCKGYRACQKASITSFQDINCNGDGGCKETIIQTSAQVQCQGDESCQKAAIDADDDIKCFGHDACISSILRGKLEIKCNGYSSCKNAQIYGANIIAKGHGSLRDATIYADGDLVSDLDVKVYGYAAGDGATIECKSGSVCSLGCQGNACQGLTLNCYKYSECRVEPDGCQPGEEILSSDGTMCPRWIEIDETYNINSIVEQKELMIKNHASDSSSPSSSTITYYSYHLHSFEAIALCTMIALILAIASLIAVWKCKSKSVAIDKEEMKSLI